VSDDDANPGTDRADLTIDVIDVNEAPTAGGDTYQVDADDVLAPADSVLANDDDPDGDALTAVLVDDVADGSLALNDDGGFTYTPDAGFSGTDGFTYRASDGELESAAATVEITVESAGKPVVEADGPTVVGSAADEVLRPGGGLLSTVAGNGGADDVDFTSILDDGARQIVRVLDYGPDDRLVGLGPEDVMQAFAMGQSTRIFVEGEDRDQIIVTGAPSLDDIAFADADVLVG
jgi:hypothetical protein